MGIDQHTTFASQARLARQLVVGHQANAQHNGVAHQRAAIGQQDLRAAICSASKAPHARAQQHAHALGAVQRQQIRRHLGGHGAFTQAALRLHHHHVGALLACGGRHLQADPATTHHHHAAARPKGRSQRLRVFDGAQRVQRHLVCTRHGQPPGAPAGAQDELVVGLHCAIRQQHLLGSAVNAVHLHTGPPMHRQCVKGLGLHEARAIRRGGAR